MTEIKIQNKLKLETPLKGSTKHFIVIGAGGTGGYVIPQLARMISIASDGPDIKISPDTLTIIDKDVVESKNLTRQNFIAQDLGKNKAEVMQKRYARAFNIDINHIPSYIEAPNQLVEYMDSLPKLNSVIVLIDCTDNNKSRILMHHAIEEYVEITKKSGIYQEVFFISSGNEEMHGQTSLSVKYTVDLKDDDITKRVDKMKFEDTFDKTYKFELPDICELFPDMEIGRLPDEESCAEQSVSAPQNIHTNYTAATNIIGYLNKIINHMPIDQFLIFFNIQTGASTPLFVSTDDLTRGFSYVANNPYAFKYVNLPIPKKSDSSFIPTIEKLNELRLKELKELKLEEIKENQVLSK